MNDSFHNLTETLDVQCLFVNSIKNNHDQCDFVKYNSACAYDGVLFDYTELTYCQLKDNRHLAIFILTILLLFLFVCISTVADKFLCPNLLTISKFFNLSDNIAGVTFLAFGNGAPDIFSSISGIAQSRPELIFASLFGAGIFDTTIVVAAILLISKKSQFIRPIIRDIIFYIIATFMAFMFIRTGHFTLYFAIVLLSFYAFYIVIVGISRCVYLQMKNKKMVLAGYEALEVFEDNLEAKLEKSINCDLEKCKSKRLFKAETKDYGTFHLPINKQFFDCAICPKYGCLLVHQMVNNNFPFSMKYQNLISEIYGTTTFTFKSLATAAVFTQRLYLKIQRKNMATMDVKLSKYAKELKQFLYYLNPIDRKEWNEANWIGKLYQLVAVIPQFCLNLCIPNVDLEKPQNGWCRLLICLNVFCAPQTIHFLLSHETLLQSHLCPFWGIHLLISSLIVLMVFCSSNSTLKPIYHPVFAFIGFAVGVIFINAISGEIVALLSTFGVIFNLSDSILGMTVLAWGNCLGDLVSDIAMAKAGYPAMALAAAFCGPMFNLLIGLGLPYCILFLKEQTFQVDVAFTSEITLQYAIITTSLCASLAIYLLGHKLKFRWTAYFHAVILTLLYLMYIISGLLFEFKIIV